MAASANPNQVPVGEPPEPDRRDFRQEVTDRIINMLKTGVAPWQKPWNPADASLDMPMNPTTGKAYRGGNAIHLMATGLSRGYGDPRWMTYRQATGLTWQVRKGEKGTQIEFWEVKAGRDTRSETIHDGESEGQQPATSTTMVAEIDSFIVFIPSSTQSRSKAFPNGPRTSSRYSKWSRRPSRF